MHKHFGLLCDMLKASVREKPRRTPADVREFFQSGYAEALSHLDFAKPFVNGVSWASHTNEEFKDFINSLTAMLDKYALYLEPELISTAEAILASEMVSVVCYFPALVREKGPSTAFFQDSTSWPLIQKYCERFSELVEAFNKVEQGDRLKILPSGEIWRQDVAPARGSSRIEM